MMKSAMKRPNQLSLANWRQSPISDWSFQHIRELLPTENILAGRLSTALLLKSNPLINSIQFEGPESTLTPDKAPWTLPQLCEASNGMALLISQHGKLVHEWYAHDSVAHNPHILFSISKSIIGTLTGVFVENGQLDVTKKVASYLPEVKQSGFAECTIQQLLDMTTSLDFEDFTATPSSKVTEYWASTGWNPINNNQPSSGLHDFLLSMDRGANPHGVQYEYQSPNTDLLGWVLEHISGQTIASLLSNLIWQPLQAEMDAYISIDKKGAARSAGGICTLPRDLLRFGEMILNRGRVGNNQIIPQDWIKDCFSGGDKAPWQNGDSSERFPNGGYRNCWYQTGNQNAALAAIGLHGQWLYLDPIANVAIVKNSAQVDPLNDCYGPIHIAAFEAICNQLMEATA
ncbi:MAG: CubicO group peptidase (beta-lactamase class C family) [Rubritalea sp.]|jgi:CubicO group peptidase (beta-lactamase class C family)